jgi:3-mercaptopyruvate sulfurtransferase SseA
LPCCADPKRDFSDANFTREYQKKRRKKCSKRKKRKSSEAKTKTKKVVRCAAITLVDARAIDRLLGEVDATRECDATHVLSRAARSIRRARIPGATTGVVVTDARAIFVFNIFFSLRSRVTDTSSSLMIECSVALFSVDF